MRVIGCDDPAAARASADGLGVYLMYVAAPGGLATFLGATEAIFPETTASSAALVAATVSASSPASGRRRCLSGSEIRSSLGTSAEWSAAMETSAEWPWRTTAE